LKKLFFHIWFTLSVLSGLAVQSQNQIKMHVELNDQEKALYIQQEIIFHNTSPSTLSHIILNDWNNAYSSKNSPLAQRFSDEFIRSFHLAKSYERGSTNNITIIDENKAFLNWSRPNDHIDIINVELRKPLLPNEKITLHLTYTVKIPKNKFTKYGYDDDGNYNLKQWFLTPSRLENDYFVINSNLNIDDIAISSSDFDITLIIPTPLSVVTDLETTVTSTNNDQSIIHLLGRKRVDFSLYIEPNSSFKSYKNQIVNVETNLKDTRLQDYQKAIVINRVVEFVAQEIGNYPFEKITVSQTDYEKNPFYGLNQLPSFISPFPDEFLFEIKFLKTYINNYLKNTLQLDPRKDNWIYDGIQMYTMMKYIEENHPNAKMMGNISKLKILKGYNIFNLDFNEQYSYFYMLMARKNLDQPIGDSKETFIKFNEQIAGKYRSGLSLRYLDNYLDHGIISKSISNFYHLNLQQATSAENFETIIRENTTQNLDWFFNTIINSRDYIDYKITKATKTKDSISLTIKNKTGHIVPIPLYGVQKNTIVFKEWLENIATDTTITIARREADKMVLNFNNEVPEYNLRNNWKSLRSFVINNRPLKVNFFRDLEDPYYNQLLFVPSFEYNLYSGFTPGLRLHNKTILDKPFTFHLNPEFAMRTHALTGSGSFEINTMRRDSKLYHIRYLMSANYSNYAEDANFLKLNPAITFRFRPDDLRDNRKQLILARYVVINREKTAFKIDDNTDNYSVFNLRYLNTRTELIHHANFLTDFQVANSFAKIAAEFEYRRLFNNNKQLNLRVYAGAFLQKNTDSEFFSFGLDRPTDYMFDYNLLGRSEATGVFSQQFVMAEGGFKSKLSDRYINQWLTTFNGSFNIWNWIEVYGDAGMYKNKYQSEKFIYDSGIRLNLVTDYFELYFPVYSSNGWEIQPNYGERIRFVFTLNPSKLVTLFTRKWL
jgi:hypothetical protein